MTHDIMYPLLTIFKHSISVRAMKTKLFFRYFIVLVFTCLLFTIPASAAGGTDGKLLFQFRFMEMEDTAYRLEFLQKQLDFFDFENDSKLNEGLITQILMLVNANFEWEEDKIGHGISDIDFSAKPQVIYETLFKEELDRNYLVQLVDDYHSEKIFAYLKTLQEEYAGYEHIIFLGDSRFVGIRDYTGYDERCHFICEIGTGYSWFTGSAYSALLDYQNQLGENVKNTAVVINLGVNDLTGGGPFDGLASQYAAFVNDSIVPLGFDIYYMSVNPVNDAACASAGISLYNGKIENFNENLRTRLSAEVNWLDTYSWFFASGLGYSGDGLHYPGGTNQAIVNEALARLPG